MVMDSVGRVVASGTSSLRFESSHQRIYIQFLDVNYIEYTKIKKKRLGMAY